jgi:hypothetical protein
LLTVIHIALSSVVVDDPVPMEITLIHNALESINPDVDFSDPKKYFTLPFPSSRVASAFDFLPDTDIVQRFRYMGRSKFNDILKEVEDPRFLRGAYALYLNGPSGIGKSYILAALVCLLIRKGNYVVYIPDCRDLLQDVEGYLRCALQLAFHRDSGLCSQLTSARLTDDFLLTVKEHADNTLYVVLDQFNALDSDGANDPLHHAKVNAQAYLGKLGSNQSRIFSTSGKHHLDRARKGKHGSVKYISLHAGLSEVRPHFFNYLV